jgi:hypothetical protein
MQNETTCLNLVKEYFDAFIKCITCQKENIEIKDTNKETELTDSQLNSNADNIISSTFDIAIYLDENNSNKHIEFTTPSNNSTKLDENITINIDGNNSGYFIKEDYIDKKEDYIDKKEDNATEIVKSEDDDNFELV